MQKVNVTAEQFQSLYDYTPFDTTLYVDEIIEDKRIQNISICENGKIEINNIGEVPTSYYGEFAPAWHINNHQDFDLLERIIDAEFGIEDLTIQELYTQLNDHIDTIGATEEYCDYCWNDDAARRYAEIEDMEYEPFYEDAERGGNWSWNETAYKFFFNVDGDNECADYEGLSPRDAWEAIQKYNEA